MKIDMSWIISFLSGGFAGAILNHVIGNYKNRIQKLNCYYVEDDIISKLPVLFQNKTHNNLQYKKFLIKNTTNRDIDSMTIVFEFDTKAEVTKWNTSSKYGVNNPKVKIHKKKNECSIPLKYFNRGDKIEIYIEIGNIEKDIFNIIEQNITGIRIKYIDKRKSRARNPVKMVEKIALSKSEQCSIKK